MIIGMEGFGIYLDEELVDIVYYIKGTKSEEVLEDFRDRYEKEPKIQKI